MEARRQNSTELANFALCSPQQLEAAIKREHERRVAAGFADDVQALQPKDAPEIDEALVGKMLEVCWNYTSTEDRVTKVMTQRQFSFAVLCPRVSCSV